MKGLIEVDDDHKRLLLWNPFGRGYRSVLTESYIHPPQPIVWTCDGVEHKDESIGRYLFKFEDHNGSVGYVCNVGETHFLARVGGLVWTPEGSEFDAQNFLLAKGFDPQELSSSLRDFGGFKVLPGRRIVRAEVDPRTPEELVDLLDRFI